MRRVLVIGYGNTLRGDDGVGQHVARVVAGWGKADIVAVAVHQLVPELAAEMATAEVVIFVDAWPGAALEVRELRGGGPPAIAHLSDPAALLALTEALYGRRPRGWLVAVPGVSFGLGEGLSAEALRGAVEAAAVVVSLAVT